MSNYVGRRPLKPLPPEGDDDISTTPYPLPLRPVVVQVSKESIAQQPVRENRASHLCGKSEARKQRRLLAGARPIDPDTDEPLEVPDDGPPQGSYEEDEAIMRVSNVGRMTGYRQSFDRIARNMRLLGYTLAECAEVFGVDPSQFSKWRDAHPSFADAWFEGGDIADAKVARALYKRALGYEHEAVKIFNGRDGVVEVPYTERYPPDTSAGQFWLTNRQSARWRNRSNAELTGAGGGMLNPPSVNVMIVPTPNGHISRPPMLDLAPLEQAGAD